MLNENPEQRPTIYEYKEFLKYVNSENTVFEDEVNYFSYDFNDLPDEFINIADYKDKKDSSHRI